MGPRDTRDTNSTHDSIHAYDSYDSNHADDSYDSNHTNYLTNNGTPDPETID